MHRLPKALLFLVKRCIGRYTYGPKDGVGVGRVKNVQQVGHIVTVVTEVGHEPHDGAIAREVDALLREVVTNDWNL